MKKSLFYLLCITISLSTYASRLTNNREFILSSELRTNYSNGSTTCNYSSYTYDINGNKIYKNAYNGADSLSPLMSNIAYVYDQNMNLVKEILLTGSDTISIIQFIYAGGNLISIRNLRKDGSLKYMDSLNYDSGGRLIEKQRYVAGQLTFFHRYGYTINSLKISDSLFELIGTEYRVTQADIFTYNTDNQVVSEVNCREVIGQWFLISTTRMAYLNQLLSAVTKYEGNGGSNKLMDSLACQYDQYGNRIKEARYNDEKALVYTIDYIWIETATTVASHNLQLYQKAFDVLHHDRELLISGIERPVVSLYLYDINGRLVHTVLKISGRAIHLPSTISAGAYIARITSGINKQTCNFTLYN